MRRKKYTEGGSRSLLEANGEPPSTACVYLMGAYCTEYGSVASAMRRAGRGAQDATSTDRGSSFVNTRPSGARPGRDKSPGIPVRLMLAGRTALASGWLLPRERDTAPWTGCRVSGGPLERRSIVSRPQAASAAAALTSLLAPAAPGRDGTVQQQTTTPQNTRCH